MDREPGRTLIARVTCWIATLPGRMLTLPPDFAPLCAVPDRVDNYALAADTIVDDIGGPADDQLSNAGAGSHTAQVGMGAESFHHRDVARGEPFGGFGFVQSNIGSNFLEAGVGQRRPHDLYRHSPSSSCALPQAHFGGGSSWSVPHESNHAFISSCLM